MAEGYHVKGSSIDGFTLRPLRASAEDETALSKLFDELDESTAGELYAKGPWCKVSESTLKSMPLSACSCGIDLCLSF